MCRRVTDALLCARMRKMVLATDRGRLLLFDDDAKGEAKSIGKEGKEQQILGLDKEPTMVKVAHEVGECMPSFSRVLIPATQW